MTNASAVASADDCNDLLASLGLSDYQGTPSDQFFDELTSGSYKKIHNLRYWLVSEMSRFQSMLDDNIKFTRTVMESGALVNRALTKMDYAKVSIRYYLEMHHLPRFLKLNEHQEPCDLATVVNMVADYPDVKEVIEKVY